MSDGVQFKPRALQGATSPDIGDRIALAFDGKPVKGGGFLQSYAATTGTARGDFDDGRLAVVENRFGKGRTLIVGTNPGIAYFKTSNADNLRYFADVFAWTGKERHLRLDNPAIVARLHLGAEGGALWLVNSTRAPQQASLILGKQHEGMSLGAAWWGEGQGATVTVPPRDVVVLR